MRVTPLHEQIARVVVALLEEHPFLEKETVLHHAIESAGLRDTPEVRRTVQIAIDKL